MRVQSLFVRWSEKKKIQRTEQGRDWTSFGGDKASTYLPRRGWHILWKVT